MQEVKRDFVGGLRDCYLVSINEREYSVCERVSSNYWTNEKVGKWGEGVINTSKDKYKAERIGLLGEVAVSRILNNPFDFSYKNGGDTHDFIYKNCKLDVKTEAKYHSYCAGLIKCGKMSSDRMRNIAIDSHSKKHIFVFGYVETENRKKQEASVVLVGYFFRKDLEKRYINMGKARDSNHFNFEIKYKDMHPITNLATLNVKEPNKIYGTWDEKDLQTWLDCF